MKDFEEHPPYQKQKVGRHRPQPGDLGSLDNLPFRRAVLCDFDYFVAVASKSRKTQTSTLFVESSESRCAFRAFFFPRIGMVADRDRIARKIDRSFSYQAPVPAINAAGSLYPNTLYCLHRVCVLNFSLPKYPILPP